MTFNEGARGEAGRVQVQGGGGGSRGSKLAIGGGAGGIIVLILALLFGGDPGSVLGQLHRNIELREPGSARSTTADRHRCEQRRRLPRHTTARSLDDVWEAQLTKQTGTAYVRPEVVLFSGSVNTGCGSATSEVGPFYCPADQTAYFDTSFFQIAGRPIRLERRPLAQEYVVAHEIRSPHPESTRRYQPRPGRSAGRESGAVRTELQADCYAGMWAHYADTIPDEATGQPFLKTLSQNDIRDALSAASSVGDDRIQQSTSGRVNPEGWTHGSSQQRQLWFAAGYKTGQVSACDTYSARDLNNPAALSK